MLFLFHQVLWKNINELLLLKFTVPQKCKNYMQLVLVFDAPRVRRFVDPTVRQKSLFTKFC
jgi:hypothetical protein